MMRLGISLGLAAAVMVALGSAAAGFAIRDLSAVTVDTAAFVGGRYSADVYDQRITILCDDCGDFVSVEITIGTSSGTTETQLRSGQITAADIDGECRPRAAECRIEPLEMGGAIGWVSTYPLADGAASTAVLFQDGDLLNIRSMADTVDLAAGNTAAALRTIAPQIVEP